MMLRAIDRERLETIFSDLLPPGTTVWAYGSRVSGEAHAGSDLDLALEAPDQQSLTQGLMHALRDRIYHSRIPILVDLRDIHALPEAFRKEVTRTGVRFFIKPSRKTPAT